jgi:hypothetical protein
MFIFLKGGLQNTLQLNEDRLLRGLMVLALSRIASLRSISHLVQRLEGCFFNLGYLKHVLQVNLMMPISRPRSL